jgi:hypothetical protein
MFRVSVVLTFVAAAVAASVTGNASVPDAAWLPNHLWGGPRIATLPAGTPPPRVIVTLPASTGDRVLCVVDGRGVLNATAAQNATSEFACDLSFLSFGGLHWVAAYRVQGGRPELVGQPLLVTREPPVGLGAEAAAVAQLAVYKAAIAEATPNNTARIGVYYTTYLNPLAQIYQNISAAYGWTRTMETVLRDDGLRFADSVWKFGPSVASPQWKNYSATCDIMHQEPSLGMYCIYRKRANESSGAIADCPEASRVLKAHAAELVAAGFDFVAPDATNWDGDPRNASVPGSDFYQLRPTEIISEEWAAARMAGLATPQLSIFAMVNTGGVLWRWYMSELFNNETLLGLDMIFRDQSGRKVFIAADLGNKTDSAALSEIANNGGLNDTVVPLMWFAPNASGQWESSGRLAYFSRCLGVHEDTGEVDFSTDAWLDPRTPCAHRKTPASPIGSSWTVSTGLSINSVPFGAVRFNGLLAKKQWHDVLADPHPTALIFAPSFNEFGSRAYPLPGLVGANNPAFFAAGAAVDDPDRFVLFEDGYGSQRSRTIEPTVEDGGRFYELFASCVRVYRLQVALRIVSNGLGCDVAGEECCTIRDDESFVHAWSLDKPSAAAARPPVDSLVTADKTELAALKAAGWAEICVPTIFGRGPTATCVDANLPFSGAAGVDAASRGPFALFSNVTGGGLPDSVPLVRCVEVKTGLHFAANNTDCAPGADMQLEVVIGYGSANKSSLFARAVHRCRSSARWYTTVNIDCIAGDEDDGILLYAV